MTGKRRFCGHCNDFVNCRTYRLHHSLYYDVNTAKWKQEVDDEKSSSEEENQTKTTSSDESEGTFDFMESPGNSTVEENNTSNNEQGASVHELEEEDLELAGDTVHEIDQDWLYMQRPRIHDIEEEIWTLSDDDINIDFNEKVEPSNITAPYHDVRDERPTQIIKWIMVFLCIWSSYCCVSDFALDILVSFLSALFKSLASMFPALAAFACAFPKSLNLLRKKLGINTDQFKKYVVCPKCNSLFEFHDCYTERFGRTVIKNCPHITQENHRQLFRRTPCNEPLLKEVSLKNGRKRLYPFKVYCYSSVIENLKRMISTPNFIKNCELWRNRNVPKNFLADIFDGKVWMDCFYIGGQPFLAHPNNYAFMLNVDWFQPFKHSLYSVGALYMVLMNLPREIRFKPENVFLVGVIPGPHEPKLTINSYLKPLVEELQILWKGIKVDISNNPTTFRCALLCVGCDIPAARKVCGFTGHCSAHGCSKCKKIFPGNVSERMDFSGFDTCDPRTNLEHRRQAEEILNQTSQTDKNAKEQEYGTRFSELIMLPYFDCVRFHIIDPMHNLFTGTAKHIMRNIWLDDSSPVINKKSLEKIQKKIDGVTVPSTVGRLPKKIVNSYGGFTADQWKTWTVIYSIFALWDILPEKDMEVWRYFVLACYTLCTPVITETKARLGHLYIMNFCRSFEELYGKHKVTPNMHLHTHLLDCILDYGPVYSFWLFSFERYNGILGEYSTNQRSIEIQIMRKFMSQQSVKAIPLPSTFADYFGHILEKISNSSVTGTLQMMNYYDSSSHVIAQSLLSIGPVRSGQWSVTAHNKFIKCLPPFKRYSLDINCLPYLKTCYKTFLQNVNESSVTIHCELISSINVAGQLFGSGCSRQNRSSFILAAWCDKNGQIDKSGMNVRPGVVQHFIRQNVEVNGKSETFILAEVKWFKDHQSRHQLGAPVEIWCKDYFEFDGPASFIPLQRINAKFVPAFQVIRYENVLITCPMPRKLQC